MNIKALQDVLKNSDQLFSDQDVEHALDRMAKQMNDRLQDSLPLFLCVLNGAVIPMGRLLCRLDFPLETDYIHATRYRGETEGAELHWKAYPSTSLKDRTVVLVDDIFDEGLTLKALVEHCYKEGAEQVLTAVLVNKLHDRKAELQMDFVGLEAEDRYLFGCGMDYREYWRNAPGIYAIREEKK
ncbi:MAG: hypoxanthine-guanine phosphoribosyltransferase [Gammaproteobacteria bacterium]|nr:MAG: hypoxanthine-guanine phosphoribosyltransferase [Gammaproteobacteria bacterium]